MFHLFTATIFFKLKISDTIRYDREKSDSHDYRYIKVKTIQHYNENKGYVDSYEVQSLKPYK